MHTTISHAAFDESGDTGNADQSSWFIVVAGIACNRFETLNQIVLRTRKDIHHKKRDSLPELKAFIAEPRITKKLLTRIAEEPDTQIFASIVDKRKASFETANDLYYLAYSTAIRAALQQTASLNAVLDMFYTRHHQQAQFIDKLLKSLTDLNKPIAVTFDRSHNNRPLQIADFVAWSIFQHVEHGNSVYRDIIAHKIVAEQTITR